MNSSGVEAPDLVTAFSYLTLARCQLAVLRCRWSFVSCFGDSSGTPVLKDIYCGIFNRRLLLL